MSGPLVTPAVRERFLRQHVARVRRNYTPLYTRMCLGEREMARDRRRRARGVR
jgi:hypothetical protein